jgi:universal stress protein A
MTAPKTVHVRQILFASDFSPNSDHAFDAALALAQHFGARLHLLHVVHHTHEQQAAQARLNTFAQERVTEVEFAVAVEAGNAASQIVAHAEREKVDLIVMGTHGQTRPLSHVVRGRVAEAVMRHAPCLVLTIRTPVELPLEGVGPGAQEPRVPAPQARRADRCLVCALPFSEDSVCDTCKARIRAEAFHRWQQGGDTAGR